MKRLTTLLLIGLLTACGTAAAPETDPLAESAASGAVELPELLEAEAAFMLVPPDVHGDTELSRIARTPGVAVVATLDIVRTRVSTPSGTAVLNVGLVDSLSFRPVTPPATRDAEFVWSSLLSGEAVVTFDAAHKLGLEAGGRLELNASRSLEVGAFADSGTPNFVDVLVDAGIGRRMHLRGGTRFLSVGAAPGTSLDALGAALSKRLPAADLVPLIPPSLDPGSDPSNAVGRTGEATGGIIGDMPFKVLEDGFIKPDRRWVKRNILTTTVTLIGEVSCHRLLVPQLEAAMAEIENKGLAALIDPNQYGGCYSPRFIDRDPSLPLSVHAFGLAVDLNVATNTLGTAGDMDPRVVAIMERWGFVWGGDFGRPDPMHFELARLLATPP